MSLVTDLDGTYDLEDLGNMLRPVAWSGTKDKAEATAEEVELRTFVREAIEQVNECYTHVGDGETDYAARIVGGELVEIVVKD